jgi:hypothetical protein
MSEKIKCRARKEAGCKKKDALNICSWDDTLKKCDYLKVAPVNSTPINSKNTPVKVKSVSCRARKENTCKERPDVCQWFEDKQKCEPRLIVNKKTTLSVDPPNKVVRKVIRKKIQFNSNSMAQIKELVTKIVKNVVDKAHLNSQKPEKKVPAPKKLVALQNRHCSLFSQDQDLPFDLEIDLKDKKHKETYDPKFKSTTNTHLGQRKLLLSEIQLLTDHYTTSSAHPTVLYIGSAPGSHLKILSDLFPHVKFILYDGAKFDIILKNYPAKFEIHEGADGFFTTEKCKLLKQKLVGSKTPLIFVSDIRLGEATHDAFENAVARDMRSQEEWVQILQPHLSLLKFRMSYNMKHGEKIEYLKGTLLYGIWAPTESGETRLLVRKADVKKRAQYDFKDYEETMFFHNKHKRSYCYADALAKYGKYISTNNAYCPCFDCYAELTILDEYTQLPNTVQKKLQNMVNIMMSLPGKQFWPKKNALSHHRH